MTGHALHPIRQENYGVTRSVTLPFAQAVAHVRHALQREGFGVVSEIDLQQKLKEKLDVEIPPYLILGACAPGLAYRGLQVDRLLGLLLPCNVVVVEGEDGVVTVGAVDAGRMMMLAKNPALVSVAEQVDEKLRRVIASV